MKLTDDDHRAFIKRACADLEFQDELRTPNEERLRTALLEATQTTGQVLAEDAFDLATSWFHSGRSLPERISLLRDHAHL